MWDVTTGRKNGSIETLCLLRNLSSTGRNGGNISAQHNRAIYSVDRNSLVDLLPFYFYTNLLDEIGKDTLPFLYGFKLTWITLRHRRNYQYRVRQMFLRVVVCELSTTFLSILRIRRRIRNIEEEFAYSTHWIWLFTRWLTNSFICFLFHVSPSGHRLMDCTLLWALVMVMVMVIWRW